MEILKKIDDLLIGWGISPSRADMFDQFIAFALILAVAFLADALCRKILLKVVAQLVKKTKATWDDIVFDRKVMVHLSRMVAPVIIYLFVPLAFVEVGSSAMDFIRRICLIYIIITFLSFVNSFLKAVYSVYSEKEQFRDRPLKGMLQTMQVILWLVGGIVVAAAGVKLVQNVGERSSTTLDILSVVLLAAGITAFVYSVGEFSTNLIAGIVTFFAAVVLLGLFAARQLKLEHPVLNVRPMASVRFWPACLLVVVSMMTTFSMSVLLPLYFEGAYGMTALIAGLLILPAIACNAVTSIVGGRVMDARGAWPLLPIGFALIAVGQTAISMTAASMNIGVVVALTVVVYAGVGLVLSPSQTAGLETLPAAEHPHGTALLNTWNMIAASFGPSLFIGLLSSSAATAGAAGAATDVAQAIGFVTAVRVAAVIAVVGFATSLVYARRESHMSH